jgi:membrane protein YdbS with pleckstrin-like domain
VAGFVLAMVNAAIPDGWTAPLVALLAVVLVVGVVVVPELRWRRWRWEVREHEIDIQRGVLIMRRTLIPMERVQHVETERGIIGQALHLATVQVHTAAGSHEIPLLAEYDAGRLRVRIAELARTSDG